MLMKQHPEVRCWLGTVLTGPDKQRLLLPQQPTFQPACPLSHHLRLLLGDERTYGGAVCRVRCCRVGPGNFTPSPSQNRT